MTDLEVLRLIGEVLAIASVLVVGGKWLGTRLVALLAKMEDVSEQVQGVNSRLDQLNGSVSRHEDRLTDLEKWQERMEGRREQREMDDARSE